MFSFRSSHVIHTRGQNKLPNAISLSKNVFHTVWTNAGEKWTIVCYACWIILQILCVRRLEDVFVSKLYRRMKIYAKKCRISYRIGKFNTEKNLHGGIVRRNQNGLALHSCVRGERDCQRMPCTHHHMNSSFIQIVLNVCTRRRLLSFNRFFMRTLHMQRLPLYHQNRHTPIFFGSLKFHFHHFTTHWIPK